MKITMRLCYFCWQEDEIVEAVGRYEARDHKHYDVCETHKKAAEGAGIKVEPVKGLIEDEVDEEEGA